VADPPAVRDTSHKEVRRRRAREVGGVSFDPLPLLEESRVSALDSSSSVATITAALKTYVGMLNGTRGLDLEAARVMAFRECKAHGVRDGRALIVAAFAEIATKIGKPNAAAASSPASDVEPWPEPVDGADLLKAIVALERDYLVLPAGAPDYLAVFTLVTHAIDAFHVAPYVAVLSPTNECGKTRLLEVLELLVRRPWRPLILTGPVLFRGVETYHPTTLVDEAEVVRAQRSEAAENVRAILHGGYRRGVKVERCVGDSHQLTAFDVFGPKVFAAIGDLPATLLSRCVVIQMQRRARTEPVGYWRPRVVEPRGRELQRRARRWALDHLDLLRELEVRPPDFLRDRLAEVWEPLFAVTQMVGGKWPARLEEAARHLTGSEDGGTLAVELLRDVQAACAARGGDRIASADLAAALNDLEGRPWPDYNKGNGIRANQVARLLGDFGVTSTTIRFGDKTLKGYHVERFADAFNRYLSPPGGPGTGTPPQASQGGPYLDYENRNIESGGAEPEPEMLAASGQCGGVAVPEGGVGPGLFDVDGPPPPEPPADEDSPEDRESQDLEVTDAPDGAAGAGLEVTAIWDGRYRVSGRAERYLVEISAGVGARCDCRDFAYGGRTWDCKHIGAVRLYQTRPTDEAPDIAMRKTLEQRA